MKTLPIQGPARDEVVNTLRASSWFRALQQRADASPEGAKSMEALLASADLVEYAPGEVILEEGFPSDSFYVLLSGTVQVRAGGKGSRVGRQRPPSSFGEVGLLLDEPRTATVIAEEGARALRIGARAFHELFAKVPEFGLDTSRYLARRLRDLTQLVPTEAEKKSQGQEPADDAPQPSAAPPTSEDLASNQPLLPADDSGLLL
jgi:CRP-like cAMP-binding protein